MEYKIEILIKLSYISGNKSVLRNKRASYNRKKKKYITYTYINTYAFQIKEFAHD